MSTTMTGSRSLSNQRQSAPLIKSLVLAIVVTYLSESFGNYLPTGSSNHNKPSLHSKLVIQVNALPQQQIGDQSSGVGGGAQAATGSGAGTTNRQPHWHRPGCYQVGHTRTISIPGCVKFNLSTNACRGYCMSFSIPVAEDIGPKQLEQLLTDQDEVSTSGLMIGNTLGVAMKRHGGGGGQREAKSTAQTSDTSARQLQDFLFLSGQMPSPLAGATSDTGDTSDKRDVISVGQCCNMMDTEDVTVNLRCGFNETRKLVFKSAKTCECFFCKHV